MTVGPSWMPRRRWRAGIQVYVDLSLATAMVALGVVTFVGHGRGAPLALEVVFRLVGLLGLAYLAYGVNGLRSVRIDGDPPVLSIPTYSLRRGYRRTAWPLASVTSVGFSGVRGGRIPYVRARFTAGDVVVDSESLTCIGDRWHPDRSRAGRALSDIRTVIEWNRPV